MLFNLGTFFGYFYTFWCCKCQNVGLFSHSTNKREKAWSYIFDTVKLTSTHLGISDLLSTSVDIVFFTVGIALAMELKKEIFVNIKIKINININFAVSLTKLRR